MCVCIHDINILFFSLFVFYVCNSLDNILNLLEINMNSSIRRASNCFVLFNRRVNQRTAATAAAATSESVKNEQKSQSKENKNQQQTKKDKQLRTSNSFVMNLFRGQFYPSEVFPYPNVLNEEQKDNVKMLIDPIWKFFEEKNDAAKNDQIEKVC